MTLNRIARSVLSMLATAVVVVATSARPAAAQGLPDPVVTATPVSDADKSQIGTFIEGHVGKLSAPEAADVQKARKALSDPLRNPQASASFRQEYSRQILARIAPLVGDKREEVAANAVRLSGLLGTNDGFTQVLKGLDDKRPSVRVIAAMSAGYWLQSARIEGKTPLTIRNVTDALDELAARMTKEQDPKVLDALVLALDDGMHAPEALTGVRGKSAQILVQQTARLAQGNQAPGMDFVFGHATKALIDALLVANAALQLPANVVTDAACAAGDVVAGIQKRMDAGTLTDTERGRLAVTAAQAERIVQRAAQQLGSAVPPRYDLETSITRSDDAKFKTDAQRLFRDLTGAPFNCGPANRFPKGP